MTKTQKMAILANMLQGNLAGLQALKQAKDEEPIMFSVDKLPKGWVANPDNERPVKVYYQLGDKEFVEYLTYAQMREKTNGVICILPHNQRSGNLVKAFASVPSLDLECINDPTTSKLNQ